ncbi:MAG: LEA type 2 family protein [Bdellovibrionota bacterium]
MAKQLLCNKGIAMKKIFRILSAAIISVGFMGCPSILKKDLIEPKVEIEKVGIADVGFDKGTLVLNLRIQNQNPYELKVDKLTSNLQIEGTQIYDGIIGENITLPASATSSQEVRLPLEWNKVFSTVTSFLSKGEANYKIQGKVHSGIISVPFTSSGVMKAQ